MISHRGFQESPAEIAHTGLAELEHKLQLPVVSGVYEERGSFVVCLCLDRVLFFQEETDDADVELQFLLVRPCPISVQDNFAIFCE